MDIPSLYERLRINPLQLRLLIKGALNLLACWTAISLIIFLKIPESFTKLYAEDGISYLEDALKFSFLSNLFTPVAGYLDIVARLAGSFVILFPLEHAPSVFFAYNTLVYTLICFTVFYASKEFILNLINRVLLSLSLILIPIAGFESIANTANLHFFLVSACMPILIKTTFTTFQSIYFSLFVFFASLSVPLTVFLFPLIVFRHLNLNRKTLFSRPNLVEVMWALGVSLQFIFIALNGFSAADKSDGLNSPLEPIYLYLDRVVGSTLIPTWGYISRDNLTSGQDLQLLSSTILIRGILSLLVFVSLIFYVMLRGRHNYKARKIAILVLVTTSIYWFCVGVVFSSAPRYAIISSFGLLFAVFCVQGPRRVNGKLHIQSIAVTTVIFLTWFGSWKPSQYRVDGPIWINEFRKAEAECRSGEKEVHIPIIPANQNFKVEINCQKIGSD